MRNPQTKSSFVGAVDLHGQQPLVAAGQPGEERLLGHVLAVEQAEIGVVGHDDQIAALFGRLAQHGHDLVDLRLA